MGEERQDEEGSPNEDAYQQASEAHDIPPIDFNIFVLSMNTSALIHLGEAPSDQAHMGQMDLAMARQTIDLLAVFEEKTRGNLTGEEERLLGQVLMDLRLRFTKVAGKAGG